METRSVNAQMFVTCMVMIQNQSETEAGGDNAAALRNALNTSRQLRTELLLLGSQRL